MPQTNTTNPYIWDLISNKQHIDKESVKRLERLTNGRKANISYKPIYRGGMSILYSTQGEKSAFSILQVMSNLSNCPYFPCSVA